MILLVLEYTFRNCLHDLNTVSDRGLGCIFMLHVFWLFEIQRQKDIFSVGKNLFFAISAVIMSKSFSVSNVYVPQYWIMQTLRTQIQVA